MRASVGLSAN